MTSWTTSCSTREGDQSAVSKDSAQSELAALMRVMESHGDAVKQAIRDGKDLPKRPVGIADLIIAKPTDGMHINTETFPLFAK